MNLAAIEKAQSVDADQKIRIAVFADSHQNYKDLEKTIASINEMKDLDFVVNLGDLTNSGYNLEFDIFIQSYIQIRAPAFTAIGNHDALGAGPEIFRKVFGPTNYVVESETKRFIFFHSANLEDPDGFDPDWLLQTVNDSTKPVFIFSHVGLSDPQRYTGHEKDTLWKAATHPRTQLVLSGHNHIYKIEKADETVLVECPRVEEVRWLLVEAQGQQVSITQMNSGERVWESLKN